MPESIGCCGSWDECADKGYCVKENVMKARDQYCQYNDNLVRGFNFHNPEFKRGPYLEMDNRQYYIGIRMGEGIRALNTSEQEILKSAALNLKPFDYTKARIEATDRKNPEGIEVHTCVDGLNLVLMKANGCPMKAPAAEKLTEDLKNLKLTFQIIGGDEMPSIQLQPSTDVQGEAPPVAAPSPPTSHNNALAGQVSLFDIFG
jgi:hypothetical protein